jgi:hypothetical protein
MCFFVATTKKDTVSVEIDTKIDGRLMLSNDANRKIPHRACPVSGKRAVGAGRNWEFRRTEPVLDD